MTCRKWGFPDWQDIAGPGFAIEMQLELASFELSQHLYDATLDRRMVRAVASDKLLDNSPQCSERQLRVGDMHGINLRRNTKSATISQSHKATGQLLADGGFNFPWVS